VRIKNKIKSLYLLARSIQLALFADGKKNLILFILITFYYYLNKKNTTKHFFLHFFIQNIFFSYINQICYHSKSRWILGVTEDAMASPQFPSKMFF
jgi:hypothetical protein